jgi:hypothetical protein
MLVSWKMASPAMMVGLLWQCSCVEIANIPTQASLTLIAGSRCKRYSNTTLARSSTSRVLFCPIASQFQQH